MAERLDAALDQLREFIALGGASGPTFRGDEQAERNAPTQEA